MTFFLINLIVKSYHTNTITNALPLFKVFAKVKKITKGVTIIFKIKYISFLLNLYFK
jgi:hypothetical protein